MATTKKSAGKTKSASSPKPTKAKSAVEGGPLPPYGVAIKEALARGDVQDMRKVAASARKHLKDVQAALDKLEKAIQKT